MVMEGLLEIREVDLQDLQGLQDRLDLRLRHHRLGFLKVHRLAIRPVILVVVVVAVAMEDMMVLLFLQEG